MSILISRIILAASVLLLAGCQLADISISNSLFASAPMSSGKLAGGVIVQAPEGYCLDQSSTRRGVTRNGLVFASCVRLQGSNEFDPTYGHVLTVTNAGPKIDLSVLSGYIKSAAGRAALSDDDQSTGIFIHETKVTRNAVYVDYTDSARPVHLGQRGWKAFVVVADKLVLLGIYAGVGVTVSGIDGEETLRKFAQLILMEAKKFI